MKKLLLQMVLVAFLLVALNACKTDTPSETTAQEAIPAYCATSPNTVTAQLLTEPDRINPLVSLSVYSRAVFENIFLYLLTFDSKTLELSPQLVKTLPQVQELTEGPYAGGVSYTFELLDEATWDNGSPITGNDFVFTLKAMFNPKVNSAALRSYLDFVVDASVDPVNPKKFTVYTNRKYIIAKAVIGNIPVYPEYIYDPEGLLKDIPLKALADVEDPQQLETNYPTLEPFAAAFNSTQYGREIVNGPGAYQMEEWIPGQRIILSRKKDWWANELSQQSPLLSAGPDTIIYTIIPDQNTVVSALKEGSIDVAAQLNARDFAELQKNEEFNQRYQLHTPSSMVFYYVGINTKNDKLNDKRVRRASAHLVDVDDVIDKLFFGLAERIIGPFHPSKDYYHNELAPIEYNLEKAVALLKEAGWEDTNGNGIVDKEINGQLEELDLNYMTSQNSKFGNNFALLFQENAKKAGVNININRLEFNVLRESLSQRTFDLFTSGFSQDPVPNDPKQVWHSESDTPGGSNRSGFGTAETDALIDQIRTTLNPEDRKQLYLKFQEIVYDEQPFIFLFTPLERIAISRCFKGEASTKKPGYFPNEFEKN